MQVEVIRTYTAKQPDELSLQVADVVLVSQTVEGASPLFAAQLTISIPHLLHTFFSFSVSLSHNGLKICLNGVRYYTNTMTRVLISLSVTIATDFPVNRTRSTESQQAERQLERA